MKTRTSIRTNPFSPGSMALIGAILLVLTFAVDSTTDVATAFASAPAAAEQATSEQAPE